MTTVPGPSAALAALVVSGLPTDRFCFEGFLPRRGGDRRRRIEAVTGDARTVVLFEAPGRLAATLRDLLDACGPERGVVVARELTKLHEEVWRGTLDDACSTFAEREVRGEIVVVVAGDPESGRAPDDADVVDALRGRLEVGDSLRDAAGTVAQSWVFRAGAPMTWRSACSGMRSRDGRLHGLRHTVTGTIERIHGGEVRKGQDPGPARGAR